MQAIISNQAVRQVTIKLNEQTLNKNEYNKIIKILLKGNDRSDPVLSIDLSGICSLTAHELSVLVYCKQYAEQKRVRLFLKNVSPVLNAFFELTRMNNFFASANSVVS